MRIHDLPHELLLTEPCLCTYLRTYLYTPVYIPIYFLAVLVDSWLAVSVDVLSKALFFSLQGVDSAISASQPFLLITKPTEENRTTLLGSFYMCFFCFSCASSGGKTQMKQTQHLQRINAWLSNLPSSERNGRHSSSASVLRLHWGTYCLIAPALQNPVPRLLVVLFICIPISHCCASLLHWCGSKWPKATGFTMDTRSGAVMQNKASSYELPMICIAEVTFYPGCAIAVI